MEEYAAACIVEVGRAIDQGMPAATSVFFGGGTPSRLPADLLCAIVGSIPRAAGAEVTVECNPEDAQCERFALYREAGVTRISLGVQSTSPHVLAGLGRRHTPGVVAGAAVAVAGAGFASWNMDLIIGGAGETDADWEASLADVLALNDPPPHISAYALTVEPGTPLAAEEDRHPDDDTQAARYERADEVLAAAGYQWEEISNWAKPGHECRHNHLYWDQGNYRGIGSAAHSHQDGRRWWNVRTPDRYVREIGAGHSPVAGEEVLTDGQRAFESLTLSLRTRSGVPADAVPDDPDLEGLFTSAAGRSVLTVRGRLLANAVSAKLLVDVPTR
jgi:oxygen-independent coproporphyrinogen-3 oxidase